MECLCQFLTFVGSFLDKSDKAKSLMDQYFQRIKSLLEMATKTKQDTTNKHFLPSRIRFMMEDLLDYRDNGWVAQKAGQRTNVDEPKLLSQLREETIASDLDNRMYVSRPYHTKSYKGTTDSNQKFRESLETNRAIFTKSSETYTNGVSQATKLTNKDNLQSVAEDDQDWRSPCKVEGSWRKAVGNNVSRPKTAVAVKNDIDNVWRRDGQHSSLSGTSSSSSSTNNCNQMQNLPPRMMRQRLEGNGKMNRLDSINESNSSSPSPTSTGTKDFSRTNYNNSNINEIFGLRKPKTLFEPDYLRENRTTDVYLGPVDKFQRPLSQSATCPMKPISKPTISNGKCPVTDSGHTKTTEPVSIDTNKNELTTKIVNWLESSADIDSMSDVSIKTILTSNLPVCFHSSDGTIAEAILDNVLIVELLIACCSSVNRNAIEKFIVFVDKLKLSPETVISVIKKLLSNVQLTDLFIINDLFSHNLSKFLAHVVLNRQMISLVSLARCIEVCNRNDLMIRLLQAIIAIDPSTDFSDTKKLLQINGISIHDIFQASDEELVTLLEDAGLIFLVPDIRYKLSLSRIMTNFYIFRETFPETDSERLLSTIVSEIGSDKCALQYSIVWLIKYVLRYIFDESNQVKSTKDLIEDEKLYWRRISPIIEYYLSIDNSDNDQLNIIYTLQQTWNLYKQPKGALLRCFICFYDLEMIDEEVFYRWKDDVNSNVMDKGKALFEVNKWLQWLKTADYIKSE